MSATNPAEPRAPGVVARSLITAVLVVVPFAVLPADGAQSASSLVVLAGGLVLLVLLVGLRVRQILRDTRPRLRAAEGLALVVPLLVALFAWSYLLLSQAEPAAFSEPLTRIDAAHFTLSILSRSASATSAPRTTWLACSCRARSSSPSPCWPAWSD